MSGLAGRQRDEQGAQRGTAQRDQPTLALPAADLPRIEPQGGETQPYDALAETLRTPPLPVELAGATAADQWHELTGLLQTAGQGWSSDGLVPAIEARLARRRRQRIRTRLTCVAAMCVLFALGWTTAGLIDPPRSGPAGAGPAGAGAVGTVAATGAPLPASPVASGTSAGERVARQWQLAWDEASVGDPAGLALEEFRDWEWIESTVAVDLLAQDADLLSAELADSAL